MSTVWGFLLKTGPFKKKRHQIFLTFKNYRMQVYKINSQINFRTKDFELSANYHVSSWESSGKKSFWIDEFSEEVTVCS